MKKQLFLLILMTLSGEYSMAQRTNSFKNIENIRVGYSLGVHAGSQGFGIDLSYATSEVFAVKVAASLAPLGLNLIRQWGDQDYLMDMKARFYNAQAVAEVKPFRITSNSPFMQKLTLVGGFGYFFRSAADAVATPRNDYVYGEVNIPKEDLGQVQAHIKWKGLAPYLGAGMRSIYVSPGFELNVDVGSYYLSAPEVRMTADKMLSESASNAARVQENMKGYRWLPVLQVGISYRFYK